MSATAIKVLERAAVPANMRPAKMQEKLRAYAAAIIAGTY